VLEGTTPHPGGLLPRKGTWYTFYRRLGDLQYRDAREKKMSTPTNVQLARNEWLYRFFSTCQSYL